ncbi:MAG: hypothetical protein AB1758_23345 [Candidatus Eremiobacterota bacterium]
MSCRRGVSLAEALLVAALVLMVFGLIAGVLVPALKGWHRADQRSQVQQNAMLVVARLRESTRMASPPSVFCGPEVVTLATCVRPDGSVDSDPSTGAPLWQKYLVLYRDPASQQVRLQENPIDPPASDATPLTSYTPRSDDRVVARHIRLFTVTKSPDGLIEVVVEAEKGGVRSRFETALTPLVEAE